MNFYDKKIDRLMASTRGF